MRSAEHVLNQLKSYAQPEQLEGLARYGMAVQYRLGVKVPDLRKMARQLGKDHSLAIQLWKTGIAEARILASMVDEPWQLTEQQMDDWAADFDSWDVCDQVCMNLFDKTPLAWNKVREWSRREEEYVRRAAYALLACLAWHDKQAPDEYFIELIPLGKAGASDGRNYVKKTVSWALRNIGKRNRKLNRVALATAEELASMDSSAARWISRDAIRDLTSDATRRRLARS